MNPETPMGVWQGQFTKLRVPMLYNLRADPFEKATISIYYADWSAHRMFMLVPAQAFVAKWLGASKTSRRGPKRRASPSTMRWSKSRRTRPRTDGVAISFHLDDATAKRLAVFLRCRRQELALSDTPTVCLRVCYRE